MYFIILKTSLVVIKYSLVPNRHDFSICGLNTTAALATVENKIPNVSDLVKKKKTDYDAKIIRRGANILPHLIVINYYNEILDKEITEKGLVDKSNILGFRGNSDLDKSHFEYDGMQS